MRYRKPFDLMQRQDAITAFRGLKNHYRALRHSFRPVGSAQRQVLRRYRMLIESFGSELEQSDARVRPERLNSFLVSGVAAVAKYYELRIPDEL